MARIAYDEGDARAFEATRQLAGDGLHAWQDAVARHLGPALDTFPAVGADLRGTFGP
jgi:hypothetical protein